MSTNVKVIVRVRPSLSREEDMSLVRMPPDEPGKTYLDHPKGERSYVFDESVWSHSRDQTNYLDNASFYRKCGSNLLEHLYQGFNVCLLAYGQTGSGKTYTMMGEESNYGLIPLMVRDILRQKETLVEEKINCEVSFSYVEIYNEKVKDLLGNSRVCRVREDPVTGPYVEGVTHVTFSTFDEFFRVLNQGNSLRMVASTKMNDASSRSHAVLTFSLRQTKFENETSELSVGAPVEEMCSNIKLVDLAGSERLDRTQAFNDTERMKEGTQINKSLTSLGRCINILSSPKNEVVPYRDSTLTYLLKENLAGNSKTSMIFCVSPTDYDETQQTLNYATQVKKIKTAAKANSSTMIAPPINWEALQEQDKSVIDKLKEEISKLNEELDSFRSEHEGGGLNRLIRYLERQSENQAFEIKYLKHQLRHKSDQAEELHKQNGYLNAELRHVMRQNHADDIQRMQASAAGLSALCGQEMQHLRASVAELRLDKLALE